MNFTCIEIEGALYQPEEVFSLGNFWVAPATKNSAVLGMQDCKVRLVFEMDKRDVIERLIQQFIFCYQFLFLRSEVYFRCSYRPSFSTFIENCQDIHAIVDMRDETKGADCRLRLNFNDIEPFHTQLPNNIDFKEFHGCFTTKYNEDDNFRNIMDLFLYTVGCKPKFYNNVFQKIAQLQTVFETVLGKPDEEKHSCGKYHFKEEWKTFLTRKLGERGFGSNDIDLIIKIKNTLNWSARVKYTHKSRQLDTWKKTLEEISFGPQFMNGKSEYTTDFDDILNNTLKVEDWAGMDWENVYFLYQVIVKMLIYLEYFTERNKDNRVRDGV